MSALSFPSFAQIQPSVQDQPSVTPKIRSIEGTVLNKAGAPVAGAVVAAGVSCVAPLVRMTLNKGLGVSDAMLGVGEDYLALKFGTEATGLSMGQVTEIARDAIEEISGQAMSSLPSAASARHLLTDRK